MYFIEFILLGNFNVQFSSLVKVNNKQTNKPNVTFSFEKKTSISLMTIDVYFLWEYSGNNNNNKYKPVGLSIPLTNP